MIRKFGGSWGIGDLGLLESAVLRPQASFDKKDLYPGVFNKAAAFLQSLLKNYPFVDGNKRTALTSAGIFLKMNSYNLKNYHKKEVEFAIQIDNENLSLGQISKWLKKHSKKP